MNGTTRSLLPLPTTLKFLFRKSTSWTLIFTNSEAEKIPEESYDIVVFRAFRPLDEKMTKTLLRIVKRNGFLGAYKAKLESIKEEMEGIKNLVPQYEIKSLFVPGLENTERNLVIVQK